MPRRWNDGYPTVSELAECGACKDEDIVHPLHAAWRKVSSRNELQDRHPSALDILSMAPCEASTYSHI